jgi:hypothetical protein
VAKNKVKGVNELKKNIQTLVGDKVPKAAERGLYVGLTLIENRSLEYVPLDTGALLNSRFKEIKQQEGLTIGRIGFVAAYALPLHSPKPGGKMDGWKPQTPEDRAMRMSAANYPTSGMSGGYNPSARQDWLNIGLEEAWPEVQRAIKEEFSR